MVAPLPFSLRHVIDALVDAFLQELTAARREVVMVRAATAVERGDLEKMLAERDAELERARDEVRELRALQPVPPILERLDLTPPAPTAALAHPLKPPGKSRLSGLSTLVGMIFGCWEVLERAPSSPGMTKWKCRCTTCGRTVELAALGPHGLRKRPPKCSHPKKKPAPERDDESDEEPTGQGDA
jgi:hypothetical protein